MKDYGTRMVAAVTTSHTLIAQMIEIIMLARTPEASRPTSQFLEPESERPSFDELPNRKVLQLRSTPKAVVAYNPLGRPRVEVVSVLVSTAEAITVLHNDVAVAAQLNPTWAAGKSGSIATDKYELWFEVTVPAFGFATYLITAGDASGLKRATKATAVATSVVSGSTLGGGTFAIESSSGGFFSGDYTFTTGDGQAVTFDRTSGFMKSVTSASTSLTTSMQLQFVTYGVGKGKDRQSPSGAYLFMPNGNAQSYQPDR